ncbi:MAG: PTS sugar transporter subunit IIA [Deltaproteobacteria bacterium]|nr:PTS sugar transporter subunit IIA [Deltaproteobacteria bacterium]
MAIRLTGLLSPERILLGLVARGKADLLEAIGALAHRAVPALSSQEVREVLGEREKLASTGIGDGIAVPHGKFADLDDLVALLVTVRGGVDFDAIDGRPVDVVVALLAPAKAGDPLKALAKVSRFLRDPLVRKRLLGAPDPSAAFEVIRAQEVAR